MRHRDYARLIREQYKMFSVSLTNNTEYVPGINRPSCERVFRNWLAPLFEANPKVFVYTSPWYVLPPKRPKPIVFSRTQRRTEIDYARMPLEDFGPYWYWAITYASIALSVPFNLFPAEQLAKQSWDPHILANLRSAAGKAEVAYARRCVRRKTAAVACVFHSDAYDSNVALFAPEDELQQLFYTFTLNARYAVKYLKREMHPHVGRARDVRNRRLR